MKPLLFTISIVFLLHNHSTSGTKSACLPSGPTITHFPLRYSTCKLDIGSGVYPDDSDRIKRTPEFLESIGYPCEQHTVRTKDSYLLTVYRIPYSPNSKRGRNTANNATKLPVYLHHGLISDSDTFFTQPGNRNLPIMLADAGYDVWLGNARGSLNSLGHEYLRHEKDFEYWNFSFHEIGIYDVPAVTSAILNITGYSKLHYIGYSMGTTQLFVGLSELPELNNVIQAAYLMAPIVYMGHCTNPLRYVAKAMSTELDFDVVNRNTQGRTTSYDDLQKFSKRPLGEFCVATAVKCGVCDNAYFALFGYNAVQMNGSRVQTRQFVRSGSMKSLSHYAQLIDSCRFQKYSFYPEKNLHTYGSLFPPEYNLRNIKVPLHLYHGNLDNFGVPKDVYMAVRRLNKGVVQRVHMVKDYYFNHVDFLMARDADILVYMIVLEDIEKIDRLK